MRPTFQDRAAFAADQSYLVLPHRVGAIPGSDRLLVTTDAGDFRFLSRVDYQALRSNGLAPGDLFDDLLAKHIIAVGSAVTATRLRDAKIRTRKAFLRDAQTLHIFVVTLRCDHSCPYCQVSRQGEGCHAFDMSAETGRAVVDLLFQSPARHLTVEFQGGEPLLAFDRIREIVERIEARNADDRRDITFTDHLDAASPQQRKSRILSRASVPGFDVA